MAGIDPKSIDDLVNFTFQRLVKKGAFVDMQTDISDFVGVRELYAKHQKVFDGGIDWEFDVQMDHNKTASFRQLYEQDTLSDETSDHLVKGRVSPRFLGANYVYDILEPVFQRGELAIVDFVKSKYVGMMTDVWETMEQAIWGSPESSTDTKTPYGIGFWVQKGATEGFTGGNPSGFTTGRAGISSEQHPRWKNYSAPYQAVTLDDLAEKMTRAHRKTRFRSPVTHAVPDLSNMANGIYTNDSVVSQLEFLLAQNNMNIGNDFAGKQSLFKSTPITYVPYLDDDSSDPVYMIDWKWMAMGLLAGWKEHLSAPTPVPNKHTVRAVYLDSGFNVICTDLRRQSVFYKAAG